MLHVAMARAIVSTDTEEMSTTWLAQKPQNVAPVVLFDFNTTGGALIEKNLSAALTLIGHTGFVLVVGTSLPQELHRLVASETSAFKQIHVGSGDVADGPGDYAMVRLFLSIRQEVARVGSATVIFRRDGEGLVDAYRSPVIARILESEVFARACLLDMPTLDKDKAYRDPSGHLMSRDQRGPSFYTHLFRGINLLTPLMATGSAPLDFHVFEFDADVGDCLEALLPHAEDSVVCWTSQVRKGLRPGEKRGTYVPRKERIEALFAKSVRIDSPRPLKRQKTDTAAQLEELVASLPVLPSLPEPLRRLQHSGGIMLGGQALAAQPRMFKGSDADADACFDARLAKPISQFLCGDDAPRSFLHYAPAPLALAKECFESGVLVAESEHIPGQVGLYPTIAFKAGATVLAGTASIDGRWVDEEEEKLSKLRRSLSDTHSW